MISFDWNQAVRDDPSLLVDKSVSRSKNDDGKSHREDKKDERRKKAASGWTILSSIHLEVLQYIVNL